MKAKFVNEAMDDVLKGKDLNPIELLNYHIKDDTNIEEYFDESDGEFYGKIYSPLQGYQGQGQYSQVSMFATFEDGKYKLNGEESRYTGPEDNETFDSKSEIDETFDTAEEVADFMTDLGS